MEYLLEIVGGIIILASGFVINRYRGKYTKIKALAVTVLEALKDDQITKEEIDQIIKQIKEF